MKIQMSFLLLLSLNVSSSVLADELDFSTYEGQAYSIVKTQLFQKGWTLVPKQEGERSMNKRYPEIVCGSGAMAICSVGFVNKNHSVAFVIKESGNHQLIVEGEY